MQLLSLFEESFGRKINYEQRESSIPESKYLALDSSLAHTYLGWFAELSPIQAVSQTAEWYSNFEQGSDAKELVRQEISIYKVGKW
jgi:nucleoside-diphosphate-sugar epimerase